jgi:WS/DGAT/MGAT family acyltransferase
MMPLSGIEDLFLRVENSTMPMHISSLTIYDPSSAPGGKVGFKDIMRYFEARVYRNKVFRNKLVRAPLGIGSCFWADDPDFDIEFHLRHIALPKPGDWRQLCIQVARLHARHLDDNHPLWECYVIEGIDNIPGLPAGCFALFMKTHYAALGGGLGTQLLAALHELSPQGRSSPPKELKYLDRLPSVADMLVSAATDSLRWPLKLADYLTTYFSPLQMYASGKLGEFARWPLRMAHRNRDEIDIQAPKTLFNGPVSPHRVFEGVKFDLGALGLMREKIPGATINDVLITVIAGAMRRYLHDKNALPSPDLLAEAPITSRSEMKVNSIRHLADSAIMPIHTQTEDPVQRLRQIVEETRSSKKNFQSFLGKRLLIDATELVPTVALKAVGELVRRTRLGSRLPPMFNTTISSIRGPDLPLYMSGAQMVGYYGMDVIHDLAGLSHLICYFAGTATISVTACRKMLPDPHRYAAYLQESFEELALALDLTPEQTGIDRPINISAPAPKKRIPASAKVGTKATEAATAPQAVASRPRKPRTIKAKENGPH